MHSLEVRLEGNTPLADILPGILFSALDPKPNPTTAASGAMPYARRRSTTADPGLR